MAEEQIITMAFLLIKWFDVTADFVGNFQLATCTRKKCTKEYENLMGEGSST